MLNPYICQYIARCSEYGIKTSLITNGICLANEQLASMLIESGLGAISTSLEGPTADTNDKIRGEHSFELALYGITTFQKLLLNSRKAMPINLQMSLNAFNRNICDRLPALINELPFDSLSIGALSKTGNAKLNQNIILCDDEYFDLFFVIAKQYQKIKNPNFLLIFKSLMPWEAVLIRCLTEYDIYPVTPYCAILNGAYSMLPDGNIVSCISLLDEKTNRVYGCELDLARKLKITFSKSVEDIKCSVDTLKKACCMDCYFADRCFLCPAVVNDNQMRDAAIQRCHKARTRFEAIIEKKYQEGCFLKLDKAQVLFSCHELIFQKNYADGAKKEFRFTVESEADFFVEDLIRGSLFRKQSFKNENKIISSLVVEGVITLYGGQIYE